VNRIQKGTTRRLILIFALILVAISLVKGVFLYAQRWILIGISREIEFDLRNDLFSKLEIQDSGFYQRYRTGDIMARMTNDLNAVRMLLGPALMYSANTIFLSVFALFFMLRISPYLTLVALAPMPLASISCSTRAQDSRALRAHPGQLLRHLRAGAGELLRRAADSRLRARGVADRALRAAQPAVHRPRACGWCS
jgi:ABC-type multidrug transport system fused ATPase/permease subunit